MNNYNKLISLVQNILDRGNSDVHSGCVFDCKPVEKIVKDSMKNFDIKPRRCNYGNCSSGVEVCLSKALNSRSNRVFVVHGRDNGNKEACARVLERLGLEPIILQEQPNSGQMISEKLEKYTDVGYAVIIMTPDDIGGLNGENLQKRARQNVIFELGLFMGKLGRSRIAILLDENIEIPSDIHGAGYIPIDSYGAWKTKLAQELKAANYDIDVSRLIS